MREAGRYLKATSQMSEERHIFNRKQKGKVNIFKETKNNAMPPPVLVCWLILYQFSTGKSPPRGENFLKMLP